MRLTPFANLHINAFSGAGITELEAGITNGMVDKRGDVFYLTQRPSIDVFEDASAKGGGSRGRGLFYWDETSALYLVNTSDIYKSSHSNSIDSSVTNGTKRVYFFVLADTLIIVNPEGNEAFNITAADAVTEITDTNFPPYFTSGAVQLAHGGAVLNQKLYVMDVNGVIYNSNSVSETATNPGKTWGPLDFIDAEREEDGGVYLGKHHDHIVAYGVSTIEFFYDAGNATGSPLNRRADVAYQIGCSTGESVWEEGDRAFFISVDFSGTLSVSTLENFSIRKISNSTLESYLTTAITRSGYSAVGSGFSARGHTFYTLTIYRVSTDIVPEITFVYDDTAGMWYHEWDTTIIPTAGTLTYNNKSFSIAGEETTARGLHIGNSGAKMYVVGAGAVVYQYTLATAYDVSTATYDSKSFDVSSEDTSPRSVYLTEDGLKMFVCGPSGAAGADKVYQYSLSTAFDVTTATYTSKSLDITSQETGPRAITFKSDGLILYMAGSSTDSIYQYTLTTAFDISTATYASKSFSFASEDTNPYGVAFSSDGANMYMYGSTNNKVFSYTLSIAYDVSSASYTSTSFDVSGQASLGGNIYLDTDTNKLFLLDGGNDSVYQYTVTGINDSSKFPLIGWTKRRGAIERFGEGMFANGDMVTITDNLLPQDTLLASGWVADGWVQTGWVSNTAGGTVGITMKSRFGMFDGGTDIHKYPKAYRQVSDESSSDMTLRWANENNTSFSTGKTLTAGYSKSTRNGRFRRRNHEIEFSGSEAKRIEAIEVDF